MTPHASSAHDIVWYSYETPDETNRSKENDVDMDTSQDLDNYSESSASNSSFPLSSTGRSKGLSSASSSASDISRCNKPELTPWNPKQQDFPATFQGASATPSYTGGAVDVCIDPQLLASDSILAHNWIQVRNGGQIGTEHVSYGDAAVRNRYNDSPTPAPQDLPHQTSNEFDIAFEEMQVTAPNSKPGVRIWLHTWVATNPDRFPDTVELESLKTLSGLSEPEIMAWLSQRVSTQLNPETEPVFSRTEENPRSTRAPRYRPKCRRSRRRFRYIKEAQDEMRMYECTHRCGLSFAKKGQWTRHERCNVEEWRCHICKFVSARKDKLLKHFREFHDLRGSTKKSHCRQLLEPTLRPCGFCFKQFDDWSAWLNHVSAHFEGQIAGGPWNMARWNEAIDQEVGSDESDDDGNDDDDDGYHNGNDEDQTDRDCDSSAADQARDASRKGKGGSYGHGSQGSSRSSGNSRSTSSSNGGSTSFQGACRGAMKHELGSSTPKNLNSSISSDNRSETSCVPTHVMSSSCPTISKVEQSFEEILEVLTSDFMTLEKPSDATSDFKAVHGLKGHCAETWNCPKGSMSLQWPHSPAELPKSQILTFGCDTRVLGNTLPDVSTETERTLDKLQNPIRHAGERMPAFLRNRRSKIDLAEIKHLYRDDPFLDVRQPACTPGLTGSLNQISFEHFGLPSDPMTIMGSKLSRRRSVLTEDKRCSEQTVRYRGSCLPCLLKKRQCSASHHTESKTTEDRRKTQNSLINARDPELPVQTLRSTSIGHVDGYPYTIPETGPDAWVQLVKPDILSHQAKGCVFNASTDVRVEAAVGPRQYTAANLNKTVIAVMGVTGAGKSNFISMPCSEGNPDHPRMKFCGCCKPRGLDHKNGHDCESTLARNVGSFIFDLNWYQSRINTNVWNPLMMVDTPGYDDIRLNDAEVLDAEVLDEIVLRLAIARTYSPLQVDRCLTLRFPNKISYDPTSARSNSILSAAGGAGRSSIVQLLLEDGASTDDSHGLITFPALYTAASAGTEKICGQLLKRGAFFGSSLLNATFRSHVMHNWQRPRCGEHDDARSHSLEILLVCDAGGGTADLIPCNASCIELPDVKILAHGTRIAATQPKYCGAGHLTRFKIERYLNDPDDGCDSEGYLESSPERHTLEAKIEQLNEMDVDGYKQEHILQGEESSYREADFASPLGMLGALRRGRKKCCEEKPDDWPV
jgi:hypothetical protein